MSDLPHASLSWQQGMSHPSARALPAWKHSGEQVKEDLRSPQSQQEDGGLTAPEFL